MTTATEALKTELATLKALALAATPGPWHCQVISDDDMYPRGLSIHADAAKDPISDDDHAPSSKDAQFIAAANPAAILKLIAAVESVAPTSEPAVYSYECRQPHTDPVIWSEFFNRNKPKEGDWTRNVRAWVPLYDHAAPVAAPAEQPKPTSQQMARWAIDGAIAYGRTGVNKPPADDHWLMEYWQIGQQLAKLGETSAWDNVTPAEPVAQAAVASEPTLICPKCGVDRLTHPCPTNQDCAMVGAAYTEPANVAMGLLQDEAAAPSAPNNGIARHGDAQWNQWLTAENGKFDLNSAPPENADAGIPISGAPVDERALFESWVKSSVDPADRLAYIEWLALDFDGNYRQGWTASNWNAWQARAALAQQAVAPGIQAVFESAITAYGVRLAGVQVDADGPAMGDLWKACAAAIAAAPGDPS